MASTDGLKIQEIFSSIQGEGRWTGTPAMFIRTSGCNLNCEFCDTDHTSAAKFIRNEHIVRQAQAQRKAYPGIQHIVLTGGEPLFNLPNEDLVQQLINLGFRVQIETNGTCVPSWLKECKPLHGPKLWVTCSPKRNLNYHILRYADEFKLLHEAKTGTHIPVGVRLARRSLLAQGKIYIQPIFTSRKTTTAQNIRSAIAECKKLGAPLSLQTHKLINVR